MDGWLVTAAVFKEDGDDDEFRHVVYAVAVADPAEAVRMTIADCGARPECLTARFRKSSCKSSAWGPAN